MPVVTDRARPSVTDRARTLMAERRDGRDAMRRRSIRRPDSRMETEFRRATPSGFILSRVITRTRLCIDDPSISIKIEDLNSNFCLIFLLSPKFETEFYVRT